MRSLTWTESLALLAVGAITYGLTLPTSQQARERELRDTAKLWKPSIEVAIADPSWLNVDVDLQGIWSRGSRRSGSEIEIAPNDGASSYRVRFYSGSCSGSCEWQTTATRDGGRLTLADPIADIWDDAFKSFWIVRVDGKDCLVPEPSAAQFNTAMAHNDIDWHYNVFTRGPR